MEDEGLLKKENFITQISGLEKVLALAEVVIVSIIQILLAAIVLGSTSEDCDQHVRLWLEVLIGVLGFHALFLTFLGVFNRKMASAVVSVNAVVFSFLFL